MRPKTTALSVLLAAVVAAVLIRWNGHEDGARSATDAAENVAEDISRSAARSEVAPPEGPRLEPPYKSAPTYCQLAFGGQATERVWIVLAPPKVYVDLDEDGDLTDEGEATPETAGKEAGSAQAEVSLKLRSGDCRLLHEREGRISKLTLVDAKGRRWSAWGDERGPLKFASTASAAPIVHFDGPLEMGFEDRAAVMRESDGSFHIAAGVGCYGRGPGSFAHLGIESVPESAVPEAVVTYSNSDQSGIGGRVTVRLRQRC